MHLQVRAPRPHPEPARDLARLQHQRNAVDHQLRKTVTRRPVRGHAHRRAVVEGHGRALVIGVDMNGVLGALQADHPIRTDPPLMVVHPARHARAPDLGHPVHRRRRRRDAPRIRLRQRHTVEALGIFLGDEGGRDLARDETRVVHHRAQERQVVPDPLDLETVERHPHRLQRRRPVRAPGAELGDHRVVEHRDLAALENAGVVPDRRFTRRRVPLPLAGVLERPRGHLHRRAIPNVSRPIDGRKLR
jgi:hypothetical protein